MTRFKRCLDAEAGAAVSEKVVIEPERFAATSDYAQKAECIRMKMEPQAPLLANY